jgi:ankyrin repeat protein
MRELTQREVEEIRANYSDLLNYQSEDTFEPIDPLTYLDSGGDALLHIAAMRGDIRTVSLLLDAGIDPNITGDMGNTALHYACSEQHDGIVELLIAHGASMDIQNEFGSLPERPERGNG